MAAKHSQINRFDYSNKLLRVLVVGKNSAIVKDIKCNISSFDLVSHQDLGKVDISDYDRVFIFSWSHSSLNDNLNLLDRFIMNRVIFISTIAVLSCVRRPQWASYPNMKLACENHVLRSGGKVIRIGVWGGLHLKDLTGMVPVTTTNELVRVMYESLESDNRIFWPIELKEGKLSGIRLSLSRILNGLSDVLPNAKVPQVFIAAVSKIIGFKNYGYTYDCLNFFSKRALVGYGAVGAAISKSLNLRDLSHSIVASCDKDLFLSADGFQGFRIGQYKEGLSRLWHGVCITQKNNEFYKQVPLLVSRFGVPRRAILGRVLRLEFELPIPSVVIDHPEVAEVRLFAEAIHLAAGVINNVKILQATHPISTTFSDHEVCEIGIISTSELLARSVIKRRLGIVFGRKVLKGRHSTIEYMLDFRPIAPNAIEFDAENIYNNRSDQIIRKLIKTMSMRLINQALFNKFGVSVDVGFFSVVIQIEAPNCINLNQDGQLTRNRLPSSALTEIIDEIANDFKTLSKIDNPRTFDAIHVHGGFDITKFPDLAQSLAEKKLFLHGNVFDDAKLGPFHNTVAMIKRECEVAANV